MTVTTSEDQVLIELFLEEDSADVHKVEDSTELEVLVGSTVANLEAQETTVVEVSTGVPGDGAGYKIIVGDDPPEDTDALWLDTSP